MNDRDQTLLDDYFDGLLNDEQSAALRRRAAVESEFGQEFALRELMQRWLQHAPQQKAISGGTAETGPDFFVEQTEAPPRQESKTNWPRWSTILVSLSVLALIGWFWATRLAGCSN